MTKTIVSLALLPMLIGLGGGAAQAQDGSLLSTFVPATDGAYACWFRTYVGEDLARRPEQQVAAMTFTMQYDSTAGEQPWLFRVDTLLRDEATPASAIGSCSEADGAIACMIEGDGGGVSVSLAGTLAKVDLEEFGSIRVQFPNTTPDEAVTVVSGTSDKLFLLSQQPEAQCTPVTAAS